MSPRLIGLDGKVAAPRVGALWRANDVAIFAVLSLLALGVPAAYFALGYSARSASLEVKAELKAELISGSIHRSPQTWRFEEHRLLDKLTREPLELEDEKGSIVDAAGQLIISSDSVLTAPVIERSATLFDAGLPVGEVHIQRSLADLVREALMLALFTLLAAATLAMHLVRSIRRGEALADKIADEQELARVTLRSIGDAVITTDRLEQIDYINPVAEALTGWSQSEARGRPVSEVCSVIDEATMQPMATPVTRALAEGQVCAFSGKDVALLRRDGTALAIEDSAAPLRNHSGDVIGAVLVFRDVSATRRMAQRITWAATHDTLTGLVNRREFESRVDAALLRARNSARQHVLCFMDLDQFKLVNDTCGHAAGDELLKQFSGLLQARLRESDTLARLGGDEFAVLFEGCGIEAAQLVAADVLAAVRDHRYTNGGRTFTVGVSMGLVAIQADTLDRPELFAAADTACYAAKEQGRNRVCVYQSSDVDMTQRRSDMNWAAQLRNALDQDRFRLYYQPYRALNKGSAEGLHIEILIRLTDEAGQMVPPGSFLPAAERYNLMPDIDRWVVTTVFSRYERLSSRLGQSLTCAINLSGTTLNSEGFLEFIHAQALLHRLPPGAVCFEVTETTAISNMAKASAFMRAAKSLGFTFALDDFGVGTSSLAYLKTLPVDYLKIDGSFIRNIIHDPIDRAMADTINRVGHIMGLQTVGEYAESDLIIEELRSIGVDFAQGYGVQRPQPLPEHLLPAELPPAYEATTLASTV